MKNKLLKILKNPQILILYLIKLPIFHVVPDRLYLKIVYQLKLKKKLNLDNPQTFNEKLQWLKLYDRNPIYTSLVDKYEVRQYIAKEIGEEYLIPLIGVWDNFNDIDFSKLPNKFVLKCTHDSGSVFICKDKKNFDIEATRKKINKALSRNYYYCEREWPYKNIKPKIICEEFLSDTNRTPDDYKVLCFNGEAKLIGVHIDRFENHCLDNYDREWNKTILGKDGDMSDKVYDKPKEFEKLISLSEQLSSIMCHARIDWFIVNDKLYFGEITLYESAGFDHFDNKEDDYILGSWIALDYKKITMKGN